MESTDQGMPLGGNPSPFSSWGEIGAPHMATLSLPGLTIGLPVWLFSTSVVMNTAIPEQSSQQLNDPKVALQTSTSSNSSSLPSSSLGKAEKAKNQVPEKKKEKKKKEKKKKEPKMRGGNKSLSSENPHTAPTRPKSPCVICKGDHYHRDFPSIPQILRDWSPRLHNPVSSTSETHVESTPSTSGSEVHGQKGKYRFPCKLCEGNHAVHHCPFLDEAKRVLEDRPVSPIRLPPGYKKLSPSPPLVENPAGPLKWSAEASIVEDEPSESTPDESQKVETAVDLVLPSEVPSSDDTVTEENEDSTVQILFVNTNSNDQGNKLTHSFTAGRKFIRVIFGRLFGPTSKQPSCFLRLESTRQTPFTG